jgi:iron complex outermembrane receptor protein
VIVNKGDSLNATPLIIAAGAEYEFNAFAHRSYARLDYSYKSANPDSTPEFDKTTVSYDPRAWAAPASQVLDTRLGTHFGATDVSLFVDNVLNSHTSIARVNLADSNNQVDEYVILRPRTIGITASYRY